MLLIDLTIITVVLPDIQSDLHAAFSTVQWMVDAYALTLAAFLLSAGSLADRYGRKRLFLSGLIVFTGGSVLCAAARNAEMLTASRAVQGIGGAILFATSLSLLAANFHGRDRGVAFGVWGAVTGIAAALGPVAGGLINLSWLGWRGVFWVNLPIGVAAIVICVLTTPESKARQSARLDWSGFLTLTAALVALVYGIIRAGEISWGDDLALGSIVAAVVLLAVFAVIESRVRRPMFDLKLLRIPTFLGGSLAAFAMNGSLYALMLYLVLYLQNALGYSALAAGTQLFIVSAASMVFSIVGGTLSSRGVPARWIIGVGLLLVSAGLFAMLGRDAHSGWTGLVAGFILTGIGSGLVNPLLAETAVGVVHYQQSGMASGSSTTFRQIGIAVGTAVYGTIFAASLGDNLRTNLAGSPTLAARADAIAGQVRGGSVGQTVAEFPAQFRNEVGTAIHGSFATSMNTLFAVGGVLALVGAVLAVMLIRGKDFVQAAPEPAVAAVH
jgi:EmrB/QacA subfamily drug resistance transporter